MQPGNAVVQYGDQNYETGLEDFSAEDLRMPRLSIVHKNGTFKDSLTGQEHTELYIVALGLIKQRVLWLPNQEDDSEPLCKSTDNKSGYPTMDAKNPKFNFPWQATGWNPNDFPPNPENGRPQLPCENCRLKEWGSHPDGKKTWCSEQHTIPLLYTPDPAEAGSPMMTALFTTQRSSITASKGFFAAIVRQNEPAFSVTAKLTLQSQQRGTNTFCVPIFTITGRTDQANWSTYSDSYRQIRNFVTQPPRKRDDGVNSDLSHNTMQGQYAPQPQYQPGFAPQQSWAPAPQQQYAQPAPQMTAPSPGWQNVQQPVQPQQGFIQPAGFVPAQPAAPVQEQYVQQAPVQQAPPQQPAPTAAAQVVQPTSPMPQTTGGRDEDPDDLPF